MTSWSISPDRSPSGGYPTTWCSSTNCPTPRPERCSNWSCANSSGITGCLRCDLRRDLLHRPRRCAVVVAVGDDVRRLAREPPDESACGDEDLAADVLRQIAGQVGIGRGDVLGRTRIHGAREADVVEQAAPLDNRVFAPGHTTLARTRCSFSSAAIASVREL